MQKFASDFKIIYYPVLGSKKKINFFTSFSYSRFMFLNISIISFRLSYLCSLLSVCLTFPLSYLAISCKQSNLCFLFFLAGQ